MKNRTFITLLIAGIVLTVSGALLKINRISYGNSLMLLGMLLEFGAIASYLFQAFLAKKK